MSKLNALNKKPSKENRKVAQNDSLLLLADFFQGEVIKLDEKF